jgi:hypothetical protein
VILYSNIIPINKKKSLILLKENALKAAFRVPTLETQKLINKKEVSPISSHPKNRTIRFPAETKINILMIKDDRKRIKRSTNGSYLK